MIIFLIHIAWAEHVCIDWLDKLSPCAEHSDCNVATYRCKGKDGQGGCWRTHTLHVPDIDRWGQRTTPLSSTDPCEQKKLAWLAAKSRCSAAEASCNANPPRASECSEANTKCEKAKEARQEFLACVEDGEK